MDITMNTRTQRGYVKTNWFSMDLNETLITALENGWAFVWLIRWLLKKGADANAYILKEQRGAYFHISALHIAAFRGHKKITELLLAYGADPLANDNEFSRRTPLDYAYNERQNNVSKILEKVIAEISPVLMQTEIKEEETLLLPSPSHTNKETKKETVMVHKKNTTAKNEEIKYSHRHDAKRFTGNAIRHDIYKDAGESVERIAQIYIGIGEEGMVFAKVSEAPDIERLSQWQDMRVELLGTGKSGSSLLYTIENEKFSILLEVTYEDELVKEGAIRKVKNYYVTEVSSLSKLIGNKAIENLKTTITPSSFNLKTVNVSLRPYLNENVAVTFDNGSIKSVYGNIIGRWEPVRDEAIANIKAIHLYIDDCIMIITPDDFGGGEHIRVKLMPLHEFQDI